MTDRIDLVSDIDALKATAANECQAFIGIDVQSARPSPFAVLDASGRLIDSGWVPGPSPTDVARGIEAKVREHAAGNPSAVAVGVDSPSRPVPHPRAWYWDGRRRRWRRRTRNDRGWGRHSDVAIAALRLANPQWTPTLDEAPEWMRVGFAIFQALEGYPHVHEVFPTASYTVLKGASDLSLGINFSNFAEGPKDMLDACVGAVTVREYVLGRGMAIGNGDGLGAIVLPREVGGDPPHPVLAWPE